MQAIFSPAAFIFWSVPSDTGGRVESRCSRWVYMMLDGTVTQRVVVHAALLHAPDRGHQFVVVRLVLHRIDVGGVHDQQRRALVFMEKPRIGVVEPPEVAGVDTALVG